jgi:hypothetical protein
MLVDLLHTSAPFRAWLLARVADDLSAADPAADFLGAWHSVTTPNGESDVEAEWQLPDGGRRGDGDSLDQAVSRQLGSTTDRGGNTGR